ncbi:PIN domain-containing protein [Parablautia intestinalis]|uniref:PIN domain-containing protein n=1 Tax=Parablautia intestinalis TaxID=2320100 RepID=UPI0038CD8EEC
MEQFDILPIKPFHLDEIRQFPAIHGDPFDRLIISQAIAENLIIITKDAMLCPFTCILTSSSGIAVISLLFSPTAFWPRQNPSSLLRAETIWDGILRCNV